MFLAGTELVRLDVSVVDERTGRPIAWLNASDFFLLENGVRQEIRFVDEYAVSETLRGGSANSDVATNVADPAQRRVVLILDDATIPADPQTVSSVRSIARRVVEGLAPSDLAAVVFTYDNRSAQELTVDRTRLTNAIESFHPGNHSFRFNLDSEPDYLRSLGTVANVVGALRSTDGRRTSIVYVTVGIPLSLEHTASTARPGLSGLGGGSQMAIQGMHRRIRFEMERMFSQAQLANVNIYTIDPAGLDGLANYLASRRRSDGILNATMPPTQDAANLYRDYLQTTAHYTGGRAVINTNEFDDAIDQILSSTASYYLVAYEPTVPRRDGRFRRLEVQVARPGAVVRTRAGYYAHPDASVGEPASARKAIAGVLPASDLPVRATALALSQPARPSVVVTVQLPALPDLNRAVDETVELIAEAYDSENRPVASREIRATVSLRAGASAGSYEVVTRLPLGVGRYHIRVGAANLRLNRAGAAYLDVDVPDVARRDLILTSLALSAYPAVVAAKDNLDATDLIPSTQRDFNANDVVLLQARLFFRGAAAIKLDVKIRAAGTGTVQYEHATAVPGGEREYTLTLRIPLKDFGPGRYTLTVLAESRPSGVSRSSEFSVR